jgi:ADP-ribosylglycohydrolase
MAVVGGARRGYPFRSMDFAESPSLQRFRGAVFGAALADALSLPYQHYRRAFLRSLAGSIVERGLAVAAGWHAVGQYTSETQETLAILASLTEARAATPEAMASHLLPWWRDRLIIDGDETSRQAMDRLLHGGDLSQVAAPPGRAEAPPLGRILAIALWHHDDPALLAAATAACIRLTHRDPRLLAAASGLGAAIALNVQTEEFRLGPFLDAVAGAASASNETMAEAVLDFPRLLSMSEQRALRAFEGICADDQYPVDDEGLGDYCVPAFFTSLYFFLKHPYRYAPAVDGALRCGGRMGTTAFLVGALCGALNGEAEIPEDLVRQLVDFAEVARRVDDFHNEQCKGKGA